MLQTPSPRSRTPATQAAEVRQAPVADQSVKTDSRSTAMPVSSDAPPSRRSASVASADRTARPRESALPARPAATHQRELGRRVADLRGHLLQLRRMLAEGQEAAPSRDAEFLDLLAASEAQRHPSLKLSAQSIDHSALRRGGTAAFQALAKLGKAAIDGMAQGRWHAVVSVGGHEVALSAVHDPERPARLSLVVVDSVGEHLDAPDWAQVCTMLGEHMNRALEKAGQAPEAQVWVNCLNTSVQKTNEGGAVFALAAVREMPGDQDVQDLHAQTLALQAAHPQRAGARLKSDNGLLGARFFKHATHPFSLDTLLARRPELENAPVNKKGQTLRVRQTAHTFLHQPTFGLAHEYSGSYEKLRVKMYQRALERMEDIAGPDAVLTGQVSRLRAYLGELKDHQNALQQPGTTAGRFMQRDVEFLPLLMRAEKAAFPGVVMHAHRLDPAGLARMDPQAIEGLWQSLAEGVRSGQDWQAILDIGGHHAALAVRHDPADPARLSGVIMEGAGSPMKREDWQALTLQLSQRLQAMLDENDQGQQGKLWLTHLDASSRQRLGDGALFAFTAAVEMRDAPGIEDLHAEALAQARDHDAAAALRGRSGNGLIDADYTTDQVGNDALLLEETIDLYEQALTHHERALGIERGKGPAA